MMVNLLTDTQFSWHYDAEGNVLTTPSETDQSILGPHPISRLQSSVDSLSEYVFWHILEDEIEDARENFSPSNANTIYASSDPSLSYSFQGTTENEYLYSVGQSFTGSLGSGSDFLYAISVGKNATNTDNRVNAGAGNDFIMAMSLSENVIKGDIGADMLIAYGAQNTLKGGKGNDALYASGTDVNSLSELFGGRGSDDLVSYGNGSAVLWGGKGSDTLLGMADNNTLIGGDGTDHLIAAGAHNDLTGGQGSDTFVFTQTDDTSRMTYVRDFEVGIDTFAVSNDTNDHRYFGTVIHGHMFYPEFRGDDVVFQTSSYGTIVFENLTMDEQWALVETASNSEFLGA